MNLRTRGQIGVLSAYTDIHRYILVTEERKEGKGNGWNTVSQLTLVYWTLKFVAGPGCIWEVEQEVGLYPHYCQRQGQATAGSFPA